MYADEFSDYLLFSGWIFFNLLLANFEKLCMNKHKLMISLRLLTQGLALSVVAKLTTSF